MPTDSVSLTCLRCGTRNVLQAARCVTCEGALALPESTKADTLIPFIGAISAIGRVRSNNEDRVGLWARDGVILAMIADGMGGAVAGEEASRLALEAIQADFVGEARGSEELAIMPDEEVAEKMRTAFRRANRAVMLRAAEHAQFQGMGTTLTLAFVRGSQVIVAHIGDSRAYLIPGSGARINQITDDHSFVEALLAAGHITPEQASSHPMRNVLYRALGQVEETEADLYVRPLSAGDWVILCSDGLTRHVSTAEIEEQVRASDTPAEAAQRLVALANERGGEDNISVVAILLEQADSPADLDNTAVGLYQSDPVPDEDTAGLTAPHPPGE
jgi:protein phosphatase